MTYNILTPVLGIFFDLWMEGDTQISWIGWGWSALVTTIFPETVQ
ncbi:hypothetical protein AAKU67_001587 [Oxalobacteraceae bacterium GrIS 2.11]